MDLIATAALALAAALLATLALTLAGTCWLLWLHVRLRRDALAAEARLLASPLPRELPHVTVQIPVYNEGPIVQRAIRAAAGLDWPCDKLHIQVLDDSTDGTSDLALSAAAKLPQRDITILRRATRGDFKAGALQAGLAAAPHCNFFAILDVDYIPPQDFLKRAIKPLLAEPKLGFSQARIDYLNAEANTLTRIQAIVLDAHLGVEQATRSWAGHPLPFNGTCGIWRRAAIEASGGWRGDTLTEDLDLSYRAWLAGWRGMFLVSVPVPGELPAEREDWVAQQRRWQTGSGEVARRMLGIVAGARSMGPAAMAGALVQLGNWWSTPLIFCAVPTAIIAGALNPMAIPELIGAGMLLAAGAEAASLASWRLGNRLLRPGQLTARQFLKRCVELQAFGLVTVLRNARSYAEVFSASRKEFLRTPKSGSVITVPEEAKDRLDAGELKL